MKTEYAYRVVPSEKARKFAVKDVIPIPTKREDFSCSDKKKETEDVFESIRQKISPTMPSRKASLFVLPYEESIVKKWVEEHHPHDDFDYALLTLELSGTVIWSEEDLFTQAGVLPFIRESNAAKYWTEASNDYSKYELPEGLFVGTATIVEIKYLNHMALTSL